MIKPKLFRSYFSDYSVGEDADADAHNVLTCSIDKGAVSIHQLIQVIFNEIFGLYKESFFT